MPNILMIIGAFILGLGINLGLDKITKRLKENLIKEQRELIKAQREYIAKLKKYNTDLWAKYHNLQMDNISSKCEEIRKAAEEWNGGPIEGTPVIMPQKQPFCTQEINFRDPPWLRDWSKSALFPGNSPRTISSGKYRHIGPSLLEHLTSQKKAFTILESIDGLKDELKKEKNIDGEVILLSPNLERALIEGLQIAPDPNEIFKSDGMLHGVPYVVVRGLPDGFLYLTTEEEANRVVDFFATLSRGEKVDLRYEPCEPIEGKENA